MGAVVGVLALASATASAGMAARMRRTGPYVARVSGALLVLAGAYVAWYGWFELRVLAGTTTGDPVVEAATGVQAAVARAVAAVGAPGLAAVALAVAAVLTTGSAAAAPSRTAHVPTPAASRPHVPDATRGTTMTGRPRVGWRRSARSPSLALSACSSPASTASPAAEPADEGRRARSGRAVGGRAHPVGAAAEPGRPPPARAAGRPGSRGVRRAGSGRHPARRRAPLPARRQDVDWLTDEEPVVSLSVGDEHRAYPVQIMVWHEIVNDTVAGRPVSVTYCPLCNSALAFDRRLGDRLLTLGTSGRLYLSDLVMYDRQTESLWSQIEGRAIAGVLTGDAARAHPGADRQLGAVAAGPSRRLGPVPRHRRRARLRPQPLRRLRRGGLRPVPVRRGADGRLAPKERVLGLGDTDDPVAVPLAVLADTRVLELEVAGREVVVLGRGGTAGPRWTPRTSPRDARSPRPAPSCRAPTAAR